MGENHSKSDILVRYKERSIELVSRHMNKVANTLADVFIENPPFTVPREHRKEVDKFRSDLATSMWEMKPKRNTGLRNTYSTISNASLILLDGPYDGTGGNNNEVLRRWSSYGQQIMECGFDISGRIIIIDDILNELVDPTLTLDYAVNHVILQQGIIGSMLTEPPLFTTCWEVGYMMWALMTAAVDVTDNLPEMRYSGGN